MHLITLLVVVFTKRYWMKHDCNRDKLSARWCGILNGNRKSGEGDVVNQFNWGFNTNTAIRVTGPLPFSFRAFPVPTGAAFQLVYGHLNRVKPGIPLNTCWSSRTLEAHRSLKGKGNKYRLSRQIVYAAMLFPMTSLINLRQQELISSHNSRRTSAEMPLS
ncbi:hypothetical protein R1flu_023680 [Riccia fluitans]|uniref:Uncharacterized protein n=1 Tax=Riccia fluitans TaxID=41844 RepID=A0ABD1XTJ7_9MARC